MSDEIFLDFGDTIINVDSGEPVEFDINNASVAFLRAINEMRIIQSMLTVDSEAWANLQNFLDNPEEFVAQDNFYEMIEHTIAAFFDEEIWHGLEKDVQDAIVHIAKMFPAIFSGLWIQYFQLYLDPLDLVEASHESDIFDNEPYIQ